MLSKIKSILKKRGLLLFTRKYELNIIGIRSKNTRSNSFDDEIHVFYKTNTSKWNYHIYKATTDPGTFWLKNPSDPQGTAILTQGQYINAYEIGLHRGQYKALVQRKPVTILRDYDRNTSLDFFNGTKQSGVFGINIHRALENGKTKYIEKFSAGCQVFENAPSFYEFMLLAEKHRALYGNAFTYTLIDFRAVRKESIRRILIGTFTLGLGLIGYFKYNEDEK